MEQYQLPKELDFQHLQLCIDEYTPTNLFIRDCGAIRENGRYSAQGLKKVDQRLKNRILDFSVGENSLEMLIDNESVFSFVLDEGYHKGFSLAYHRVEKDGTGVMLPTGVDPYDSSLPEPTSSLLRIILSDENYISHMMEIEFDGRVHLAFHSWWEEPHWKYWKIIPPP
jgi:hypothetical protein